MKESNSRENRARISSRSIRSSCSAPSISDDAVGARRYDQDGRDDLLGKPAPLHLPDRAQRRSKPAESRPIDAQERLRAHQCLHAFPAAAIACHQVLLERQRHRRVVRDAKYIAL
jgi:hypothetical protein